MREDDDTEIRYFMPVVRRLVILAAVITAVPVVMWTITGFVRNYMGPVRAPTFQTMMAAPAATAPDQTATIPADNPPAPVDPKAAQLPPMPQMNAAADSLPGSQSGVGPGATVMANAAPAGPVAAPPLAPAAAGPGKMAMSNPPTIPPPANPAPSAAPFPDRTANGIWPAAPIAPMAPTSSATLIAPGADALPQSEPIVGPVPLPRKRPRSFVVAQAGIPVPRPRPAPAATPSAPATAYTVTPVSAEAPASSGSPFGWLVHLFQPSSPAAASGPQEDLSGAH
jgi:hypothetical protein